MGADPSEYMEMLKMAQQAQLAQHTAQVGFLNSIC